MDGETNDAPSAYASSSTATGDQETHVVHYDFSNLTQMQDAVQEEIVLDGEPISNHIILQPVASQMSLVSSSQCNPEIGDDSECLDMMLEEEIVTDTQHHHGEDDNGEELLMILDMNDDDVMPSPDTISAVVGDLSDGSKVNSSCNANEVACVESKTNAQTQSPISLTTATTLPIVKIVPYTVNPNRLVMKIQSREPPDGQPGTAIESQGASESASGSAATEDDDPVAEEACEGEMRETNNTEPSTATQPGSSLKVPREMKQLQEMVHSSKVLTEFMATANHTSPTTTDRRKSRKAVGRPKKVNPTEDETAAAAEHESPKRQSIRALEAAAQKKRAFAEISMDATTTTTGEDTTDMCGFVGEGDPEDAEMDYHSDNETNESVMSGGTDSMSMKLPKVNSNSTISIIPAPKVSLKESCNCDTEIRREWMTSRHSVIVVL